jgi:hypothetical protein
VAPKEGRGDHNFNRQWAIAAAVSLVVASGCTRSSHKEVTPTTSTPTTSVVQPPTSSTIPQPATTTSTAPAQPTWPSRTIVASGSEGDLAPTTQALYWLNLPSSAAASDSVTVSPARYDLSSRAVRTGPALNGQIGDPSLTVTGGWVWVVVGKGTQTVAEQLDPDDLAVRATHALNDSAPTAYPNPILAATVDGPLFVASGNDLWALNPVSGAIDYHLITASAIASMSTDPAGRLLYTVTHLSNGGGEVISEYDTGSGRLLQSTDETGVVAPGTAAATVGGVWLSFRTGMQGTAVELSSTDLRLISPPDPGFPVFEQTMGVGSGVSEGVLWLSSLSLLTCANPTEGAVRASEPVQVYEPVASGHVLYAEGTNGGIVAVSPPAACWRS